MFFVNKAMKLNTLKIHMHMAHTKNQKYLFLKNLIFKKEFINQKYTIYSPKSGFKNMRLRWICLGHK